MSPHLAADSALFVLALADDDPEKRAALQHARNCAACRELLDESRRLLQMFDAVGSEDLAVAGAALAPNFEARVRGAVYDEAQGPGLLQRITRYALLLGAALSAWLVWREVELARPLQAALGFRCFLFEQCFALAALALGLVLGRRYLSQFGAGQGALLAMSGALVGQALLRTRCEAQGALLHLLLFHALGVVIASVWGGAAARFATRERRP